VQIKPLRTDDEQWPVPLADAVAAVRRALAAVAEETT